MHGGTTALSSTPVTLRGLLHLAWPVVLARASQSVIGFCDALMVAPLGEAELAAATTGSLNSLALLILTMGTVFIVQSFAAQLRGRGELDAIPRYAWYGMAVAALAGVLGLVALPLVPWLIARFDYAPEVAELMTSYMTIRMLSLAPATASEALGNWYAGLERTKMAMLSGLCAMVANVAGNYLLIEPRFGLPGWGVTGAAWASVLASCVGFVVLLVPFLRGYGYQRPAGPARLSLAELVRVLRFGVPNGINWFLEFAAFTLFINAMVGHLGTTVLAAFNVAMSLNSISFMPAFGLSSAGAILVGEAIGRRAHHQVWRIVKLTGAVASGWMVTVGLVYVIAPEPLIRLFEPEQTVGDALLRTGITILMLSAVWQLFDALQMTLSETLRAAGDTAWCMAARVLLAWVVFMPSAYLLVVVNGGGLIAAMLCLIGYMVLLAAALSARFASGRWKHIDLVGGEPSLI